MTGDAKARMGFTRKEFGEDAFVGLTYFGVRYFDPEVGVWTACDPAGQYFNAYGYASNGANPIIFVDENGEWLGALIGFAAGAYLGGAMSNGFELNPRKWDWENPGTYLGMMKGGISEGQLGNSIEAGIASSASKAQPNTKSYVLKTSKTFDYENTRMIQKNEVEGNAIDRQMGGALKDKLHSLHENKWTRFLGWDKKEWAAGLSEN